MAIQANTKTLEPTRTNGETQARIHIGAITATADGAVAIALTIEMKGNGLAAGYTRMNTQALTSTSTKIHNAGEPALESPTQASTSEMATTLSR